MVAPLTTKYPRLGIDIAVLSAAVSANGRAPARNTQPASSEVLIQRSAPPVHGDRYDVLWELGYSEPEIGASRRDHGIETSSV